MRYTPHYPVSGEMKKHFNAFCKNSGVKDMLPDGSEDTFGNWLRFIGFLVDQKAELAQQAADMVKDEAFNSFENVFAIGEYRTDIRHLFGGDEKIAEAFLDHVKTAEDLVKIVSYNENGLLEGNRLPRVMELLRKHKPPADAWFKYADVYLETTEEKDFASAQCIASFLMETTASYETWQNILTQLPVYEEEDGNVAYNSPAAAVLRRAVLQKLLELNEPFLAPQQSHGS